MCGLLVSLTVNFHWVGFGSVVGVGISISLRRNKVKCSSLVMFGLLLLMMMCVTRARIYRDGGFQSSYMLFGKICMS